MRQPRVIRSLLTSALQLWLRSLVTQVDTLTVNIDASDRQLLGGYIPRVTLQATDAVYSGLQLCELALSADNIRVNLRQILRGKPFQLLDPIAVQVQTRVSAAALNRALSADLLSSALETLVHRLLPKTPVQVVSLGLAPERLILQGSLRSSAPGLRKESPEGIAPSVVLSTRVMGHASTLHLSDVQLLAHPDYASPDLPLSLPSQSLPLGDVFLQKLDITPEAIALDGELKVWP